MIKITLPNDIEKLHALPSGTNVLLDGVIFTARDQAHLKLIALNEQNKPLPVDLNGQAIYYAGPCPAPVGKPIGSCGPTTSARMDGITQPMLDLGVRAFIGKGARESSVIDSINANGGSYLLAIGGAGALYANCVKNSTLACFEELGCEAIYRLEIQDFPVIKY